MQPIRASHRDEDRVRPAQQPEEVALAAAFGGAATRLRTAVDRRRVDAETLLRAPEAGRIGGTTRAGSVVTRASRRAAAVLNVAVRKAEPG